MIKEFLLSLIPRRVRKIESYGPFEYIHGYILWRGRKYKEFKFILPPYHPNCLCALTKFQGE